jgi:hypothetical protein
MITSVPPGAMARFAGRRPIFSATRYEGTFSGL